MNRASENPVFKRSFLESILAAMQTNPAAALQGDWTIKLFTAGPAPLTPSMNSGEFTVATFVGYANVTVATPTINVNTPSNEAIAIVANALFSMTAITTPETVLGYFVTSTEFGDVNFAEIFDQPVPFANIGDYLSLDVIMPFMFIPSAV